MKIDLLVEKYLVKEASTELPLTAFGFIKRDAVGVSRSGKKMSGLKWLRPKTEEEMCI
mgnify:CR=1 FL=1